MTVQPRRYLRYSSSITFLQLRSERHFVHYDMGNWLHGSNGIDRGDFDAPFLLPLHNNIAW